MADKADEKKAQEEAVAKKVEAASKVEEKAKVIARQKKEHEEKFADSNVKSVEFETSTYVIDGVRKEKVREITVFKSGIKKSRLICVRKFEKGKKGSRIIGGVDPDVYKQRKQDAKEKRAVKKGKK